jgi:hypothetical protein
MSGVLCLDSGNIQMNILGKLLQFLGMTITGAALVVGIAHDDPRMELSYLAGGAILFMFGVLILRFGGRKS